MPDADSNSPTAKPNTNAEGKIDTAADMSVDPEESVTQGADALRASEAPENKQATERPKE